MVIIKLEGALFAATCVAVDGDTPTFAIVPQIGTTRALTSLAFVDAKTEADLDAMSNNSWTWPPRV
jgi:hypothetical protein